jgi:hypothetical protein
VQLGVRFKYKFKCNAEGERENHIRPILRKLQEVPLLHLPYSLSFSPQLSPPKKKAKTNAD